MESFHFFLPFLRVAKYWKDICVSMVVLEDFMHKMLTQIQACTAKH